MFFHILKSSLQLQPAPVLVSSLLRISFGLAEVGMKTWTKSTSQSIAASMSPFVARDNAQISEVNPAFGDVFDDFFFALRRTWKTSFDHVNA